MTSTPASVYFLILSYVCLDPLAVVVDENEFVFNGFKGADIHLDGAAKIQSNGLLQLTNTSSKRQIGHAFNQFPIRFDTSLSTLPQALSFSTNFVFAIVPQITNLSAHGIAFAISPSIDFTRATGSQYFGLLNSSKNGLPSNHLLAIELDNLKNPELNDTDGNHVGIDVNSLESNVSATVTYYSNTERINRSLELISGSPMQVWIEYEGFENVLNVTLAPITSPKPDQSLLSTHINLSSILLDSMYVGFSATTGTVVPANHYILGWSFNKSGKAQGLKLSKLPSLPHERKPRQKPGLGITLSMTTIIIGLTITIAGIFYVLRRKKFEEIREDWEGEYGPHRFSYKDLFKATRGFIEEELLGAGGFGKVYRGVLPSSNQQVAVKKVSHDSSQGMREFVAEIASMGRLRHRNLVQLLGYTRRKGELLLVYDYMPNGSLDKFLFTNEKPILNWAPRYRIIRGVASALLYLHEEWELVVLHRDVKASNVLLDADLNGKLGDFSLARLYDHGANQETTHVVGTVGYLAPELTRTGKATTSSDVFAFGAFILEVACGRRPIQLQRSPKEVVLVDWVFENLKVGAVLETSDPRLGGAYLEEEMELVLKLGLLCSGSNAATRPSMRQVMQYLDGDALLPEISHDTASIGTIGQGNEASSEFVMSSSSSVMKCSAHSTSTTESILKLLGYTRRKGELLLVNDYMPNGSLDKFLFSNEKGILGWAQRYHIIRGVASALLYLHEEWEQVVLHRDVKASNVLLDADLNGRLGDFGLARLYNHGANPETTHVVGTIGYLAPELTRIGKATTSTDVFSFGVFIFEVACGRRPIQPQRSPEEVILVDWVFENLKAGTILETSDPRLGRDYLEEEMELVLKLGLLCSGSNAATRPTMRQVMQYLDGDVRLPEISHGTASIGIEASSDHSMSCTNSIFNSGR